MIQPIAIYVLWLREMKKFVRAKSRVIGTLGMPLFLLVFLGFGFRRVAIPGIGSDIEYIQFLVPGIVGMTLLFSATFAGISVLWDREFGFLKEIMVTPVSRISIVLGRVAGGATTSMIQGILILALSIPLGFQVPGLLAFLFSIALMILIAVTFICLGLIFASNMKDIHGFTLIMNFIVFPLFLLSGALFPIENLPGPVLYLAYADPLTYGVDGLRTLLITRGWVPSFPILIDAAVLAGFTILMVFLGAFFFERSEAL
ncbi:MAG: ABC transporter permease [Methanomicrobiales archaeon]|nr:ABC transporter permease [Methanomicrobiales archaeon]